MKRNETGNVFLTPTVFVAPVKTYPKTDVLRLLDDLDVDGRDQFVVAASDDSELHLVPELEGLRCPVVADDLGLPRGVQVVDGPTVTVSGGRGGSEGKSEGGWKMDEKLHYCS